jgi:hypothetical protein
VDGEVLTFGLWLGRVVDARKQRGRIFQPDGLLSANREEEDIFITSLFFFQISLTSKQNGINKFSIHFFVKEIIVYKY